MSMYKDHGRHHTKTAAAHGRIALLLNPLKNEGITHRGGCAFDQAPSPIASPVYVPAPAPAPAYEPAPAPAPILEPKADRG